MPIINLKISGNNNPDLNQELATAITLLTEKHLKKKPVVTAITIMNIPHEQWFVNAQTLKQLELNSFYLDIKVTLSRNLKNEKADYIQAIFDLMARKLSPLHSESYVYVEEVLADAYGFGGKTQEERFIQAKLNL